MQNVIMQKNVNTTLNTTALVAECHSAQSSHAECRCGILTLPVRRRVGALAPPA